MYSSEFGIPYHLTMAAWGNKDINNVLRLINRMYDVYFYICYFDKTRTLLFLYSEVYCVAFQWESVTPSLCHTLLRLALVLM